jgi:hypothetical protein
MELVGEQETAQLWALTGGVSLLIVLAKTARGLLCIKQALPHAVVMTAARDALE